MPNGLSHTLSTLIILVAVYAGGATLCSFLIESIAGAFQLRGAALYRGIVNLVGGYRDIVNSLYQHPLVHPGDETPKYGRMYSGLAWLGAENNWPSYLDARNFSTAFWQTVQTSLNSGTGTAAVQLTTLPAELISDLRARVDGIDPNTPGFGQLKPSLTSMLTQAGDDYDKLLTLTDAWFNRQMDRVAGWYRRMSQWILITFALVLCLGANIDTIHVFQYFETQTQAAAKLADDISKAMPSGGASQDQIKNAQAIDQVLASEELPFSAVFNPTRSWGAVLGDLITALAFAMGAPFWFDLLNKLINVRMAGQKPDDKPNGKTQKSAS